MPSRHVVRPAKHDDAAGIRAVARASWHAAYDDFLGPGTVERMIERWYALESLERAIRSPDQHLFVVDTSYGCQERLLTGFVHVGPWPDGPATLGKCSRLYVHPGQWGEGIGTELLERGQATLAQEGYHRVRLEVFEANERGQQFYRGRGYTVSGTETERLDGTNRRLLLMEAPLRQ